jgi:flagellar assembly factor FliW
MPRTKSKHFGQIEYSEELRIEFPLGLPGFEQETSFLAIEREGRNPILFLQSLLTPMLCFLVAPVFVIDPAYQMSVRPEDLQTLELQSEDAVRIGEDLACWVILSVPEGQQPSANLSAPIVVNLRTKRALQAIRTDSRYCCRQVLGGVQEEAACS